VGQVGEGQIESVRLGAPKNQGLQKIDKTSRGPDDLLRSRTKFLGRKNQKISFDFDKRKQNEEKSKFTRIFTDVSTCKIDGRMPRVVFDQWRHRTICPPIAHAENEPIPRGSEQGESFWDFASFYMPEHMEALRQVGRVRKGGQFNPEGGLLK